MHLTDQKLTTLAIIYYYWYFGHARFRIHYYLLQCFTVLLQTVDAVVRTIIFPKEFVVARR